MENNQNILFEVITGKYSEIGVITLNRPKALNALNMNMTIALFQQLKHWADEPNIKAVIIKSSDSKAFCAGGDLKELYEAKINNARPLTDFFWHEYRLNNFIKHYPKPYIALLDGITMGGGAGISLHGSHRIATENFIFAMPEAGIGLFPDVGGSYFLSCCPQNIGTYLGLTGMKINAADAKAIGLIDYFILKKNLDEIITAISNSDLTNNASLVISTILKNISMPQQKQTLLEHANNIADSFHFDTIEEIFNHLKQHNEAWHQNTYQTVSTKSPTSLKITLEQLRRGAKLTLSECLQMEYRMVNRILTGHDFYAGIKALLIDKSKQPKWQPDKLNQVTAADIKSYFLPLADSAELQFD